MPETATVVNFPVTVALECPQCGAAGQGSCHCGVPYVPAGDAAAKAIAENPDLSDRAIAEKTGIGHATISRRRLSTVSGETVDTRIGRDGKRSKMPVKKEPSRHLPSDPIAEPCLDCNNEEERWQRSLLYLAEYAIVLQDFWAREFGEWEKFAVTDQLITIADEAAQSWKAVADNLRQRMCTGKSS